MARFYYFIRLERPPSTLIICPVIQLESFETKKAASFAMSWICPILGMGCAADRLLTICSLDKSPLVKGVSVTEGAIALTRILGASSAAKERVKPWIAPLAIPIEA
jgi:hypothetical protein